MVMSDLIAIGILVICIVLGILGMLKWILRLVAGLILGVLILVGLGMLADNPKFNEASHGIFKDGVVIPCMRSQVRAVGELMSLTEETSYSTIARNE